MDWRRAALDFGENFPVDAMPSRIAALLRDEKVAVWVACSGGADSIAALLLCYALLDKQGALGRLRALHFDHQLRGVESSDDAVWVSGVAEALDVPLFAERWEKGASAGNVSEEQARTARMRFFQNALGDEIASSVIVTGHHANDVVETFFMRAARGSGAQGLCAPRPVSVGWGGLRFARPLLGTEKTDIIAALRKVGAAWREDSTNAKGQFLRNRIRHELIPVWERLLDRDAIDGVGRSRSLLEEDFEALASIADQAWERCCLSASSLSLPEVIVLPKALQRRLLIRFVAEQERNLELTASSMDQVLGDLEEKGDFKVSLGKGVWLCVNKLEERIVITHERSIAEWPSAAFPLGVACWIPGLGQLSSSWVTLDSQMRERILSGDVSHADRVFLSVSAQQAASLRVRRWESGDSYCVLGRHSAVKLKKLFADRKIPQHCRHSLPLIVLADGSILWVPGLPPNACFTIDSHTTHALQLTYQV